jgi:prophage maintenance system killer protein
MRYLSVQELTDANSLVAQLTGGGAGVRDMESLYDIVTRIRMNYQGQEAFSDVFSKAATLVDRIRLEKPFNDRNVITGITAAGAFLRLNGHEMSCDPMEMVRCCRSVWDGVFTVPILTEWFRTRSVRLAQSSVPRTLSFQRSTR